MALHLLERDRNGARHLAEALTQAMQGIRHCSRCRGFSESELCRTCSDPGRDDSQICVVEFPADQIAVEQATAYRGRYFVLMGRLSPLDGIGPEELGMEQLAQRMLETSLQEVIVATNATVEGEATAHYISGLAKASELKVTRLAQGVPLGGELEYLDRSTLARAFGARLQISS